MNKWILTTLLFGLVFNLNGCEKSEPKNTSQWPLNDQCDLHKTQCASQVGQAEVSLKINPHPIPIARPLGIEVTIKELAAQKVELDISGLNMYMGYNRITLISTKPGHFVGTSMLAFCTQDKMEWQLTLIIHQPDGSKVQVPFLLNTQAP